MIADKVKAALMEAPCSGVEFREAPVAAVFGKDPIKRADGRDGGDQIRVRLAARTPGIESGQKQGFCPLHGGIMVNAERLVVDRTACLRAHVGTLKKYLQPPFNGFRRT